MSDLIKALGRFASRDLLYIAAGLIVLASIFTALEITLKNIGLIEIIVLLSLAYIVSYSIQEIFAVVQILCLRDVRKPFWAWGLFNLANGVDITSVNEKDATDLETIRTDYWLSDPPPPDRFKDQIERFFFLRDICVKFGSSLLFSPAAYILIRLMENFDITNTEIYLCSAVAFLGIFLCGQSYFRTTQITAFLLEYWETQRESA